MGHTFAGNLTVTSGCFQWIHELPFVVVLDFILMTLLTLLVDEDCQIHSRRKLWNMVPTVLCPVKMAMHSKIIEIDVSENLKSFFANDRTVWLEELDNKGVSQLDVDRISLTQPETKDQCMMLPTCICLCKGSHQYMQRYIRQKARLCARHTTKKCCAIVSRNRRIFVVRLVWLIIDLF